MKKFRVPDYDIEIESHELLIMNTPTFQRLFRLYQLGFVYLIYPFATHTRAAHTIETLHYAQKIIDSLNKNKINKVTITAEQRDLIRMAALLHDIAHLPFSHTLEDENKVFPEKHDNIKRIESFISQLEKEIIQPDRKPLSLLEPEKDTRKKALNLLEQAKLVLFVIGKDTEDVEKLVADEKLTKTLKKDDWFIVDIVGDTICADLFAYIKRDVEYTGIEKRHGGYRIFNYLKIKKDKNGYSRIAIGLNKAGFRIDIFSAILDILDVRYALMERVIFHHAKCAASAMLAKAARLIKLEENEKLYKMGDEKFLDYVFEKATDKKAKLTIKAKVAAENIINNLNSRIFYKRVYSVTRSERNEYDKHDRSNFCDRFRNNPSGSLDFEEKIEKKCNLPCGSIAIFCPKEDMHLKQAKIMVDWGQKYVHPLNSDKFKDHYPRFGERVRQIEEKYRELWTFYVFMDPDEFAKVGLVQECLLEELKVKSDPLLDAYLEGKPNYLKSKEFMKIARDDSHEIKANALDGMLKLYAFEGKEGEFRESCKSALNSAKIKQIEKDAKGSKKPTRDSKQRGLFLSEDSDKDDKK